MEANIFISGVTISPNPVNVGAKYIISVTVENIIQGILTDDNCFLTIESGDGIERSD